jgi:hypothetical protein
MPDGGQAVQDDSRSGRIFGFGSSGSVEHGSGSVLPRRSRNAAGLGTSIVDPVAEMAVVNPQVVSG